MLLLWAFLGVLGPPPNPRHSVVNSPHPHPPDPEPRPPGSPEDGGRKCTTVDRTVYLAGATLLILIFINLYSRLLTTLRCAVPLTSTSHTGMLIYSLRTAS